MKKTNQTYGVYVANPTEAGRIGTGTKKDMINLFELTKNDPTYELVELLKWSAKYNCWYAVDKYSMYN